jgi:hypothetical protein
MCERLTVFKACTHSTQHLMGGTAEKAETFYHSFDYASACFFPAPALQRCPLCTYSEHSNVTHTRAYIKGKGTRHAQVLMPYRLSPPYFWASLLAAANVHSNDDYLFWGFLLAAANVHSNNESLFWGFPPCSCQCPCNKDSLFWGFPPCSCQCP